MVEVLGEGWLNLEQQLSQGPEAYLPEEGLVPELVKEALKLAVVAGQSHKNQQYLEARENLDKQSLWWG